MRPSGCNQLYCRNTNSLVPSQIRTLAATVKHFSPPRCFALAEKRKPITLYNVWEKLTFFYRHPLCYHTLFYLSINHNGLRPRLHFFQLLLPIRSLKSIHTYILSLTLSLATSCCFYSRFIDPSIQSSARTTSFLSRGCSTSVLDQLAFIAQKLVWLLSLPLLSLGANQQTPLSSWLQPICPKVPEMACHPPNNLSLPLCQPTLYPASLQRMQTHSLKRRMAHKVHRYQSLRRAPPPLIRVLTWLILTWLSLHRTMRKHQPQAQEQAKRRLNQQPKHTILSELYLLSKTLKIPRLGTLSENGRS